MKAHTIINLKEKTMRNYIQPGDTITVKATQDVKSGSPATAGSIFGIACTDAIKDQELELKLTGVFSLPKVPTESWQIGTLVYWDESEKALTIAAENNQLIGVAVANANNPSSFCQVRLNGVFMPRPELK